MARRKYEPQDRRGLKVGDTVRASKASGYDGYKTGIIREFLAGPNYPNNGAALVEFSAHPVWGDNKPGEGGVRAYVDCNQLTVIAN